MLSEHETLELLEQLKLGVIPAAGFSELEIESIGHWPILMGGGMCLNLQAVAALELNSQPEYIDVTSAVASSISCIDLASTYRQVHHLSTGVDGRTLIIAYDQQFPSMLSLLQETDYHSGGEYSTANPVAEAKSDLAARLYEFSQAMATSIDPGPSVNGQPAGLSFLALDDKQHTLVGSWQLQLRYREFETEFFIGLINSHFSNANSETPRVTETFSMTVRPERICRGNGPDALVAELAEPALVEFEEIRSRGCFRVGSAESSMVALNTGLDTGNDSCNKESVELADLLVQKMLQLSVDDLYLLMTEAIGKAAELRFSFEIEPVAEMAPAQLLREGRVYRCITVNGLPVRQACLVISSGKYLLKSYE